MERENRYANLKEERNKEIVFSIGGGERGEEKKQCVAFPKVGNHCANPLGSFGQIVRGGAPI